ncbi:MAG: hypothetical protein Q9220_000809 [cf. Caloplaca sp. 1 TL-2023]
MAGDDGSEDVNDFLLRIRELGDQRDREDEERNRKLEEEILQGRKERQARRAGEMVKDTPKEPYEASSQQSHSPAPRNTPQPPAKPESLADISPTQTMVPSRAGTVSWQQRPSSRGSTGQRARPLSQIAAENSAARSPRPSVEPTSMDERDASRNQIAESLGSKDPAWFRQTLDRGHGSAAYRRNQEESSANELFLKGNMRLPGMSREMSREQDKDQSPASTSIRSSSPLRGSSTTAFASPIRHASSISMPSANGSRSPFPSVRNHELEPYQAAQSGSKDGGLLYSGGMAAEPSQGRISPERLERPSSPTKGLGGFVQSAMLKRSDSVNKRWSAQPTNGLSRGNSVASTRNFHDALRYGSPALGVPNKQGPHAVSSETSPITSPRPGSSNSTSILTQPGKENGRLSATEIKEPKEHGSTSESALPAPNLQHHALSSKNPELDSISTTHNTQSVSPPSSPSKKWSPTKSSWLENAINKPDSPKPKLPAPSQPSWMASISQAKQKKGSIDLGKGSAFEQVSTGGLLRSPPMGASNQRPSLGNAVSSNSLRDSKPYSEDVSNMASHEQSSRSFVKPERDHKPVSQPDKTGGKDMQETKLEEAGTDKPTSATINEIDRTDDKSGPLSQLFKSKPETPPKKDFRSTLRSRQVSADKKPSEDAEFKNVFGKLKRTQTQNYVAPDELKDNILRGKAGLAATGGPKKTERRDEFKESLLKQKEAMKAGLPPSVGRKPGAGTGGSDRVSSAGTLGTEKSPAALKNVVDRSSSAINQPKPKPEALAHSNRLKEKSQPMLSNASTADGFKAREDSTVASGQGLDFNTSLAGILSRGPGSRTTGNQSIPGTQQVDNDSDSKPSRSNDPPEVEGGPQLTHMTKARARGPRRRLPTGNPPKGQSKGDDETKSSAPTLSSRTDDFKTGTRPPSATATQSQQSHPLATISHNNRKPSQPKAPRKPSLNVSKPISAHPPSTQNFPTRPTSAKPGSPYVGHSPQPPVSDPSLSLSPLTVSPTHNAVMMPGRDPRRQNDQILPFSPETSGLPSVKGAAAKWGQIDEAVQAKQVRSPIKLPTKKDEEAAMRDTGLDANNEAAIGLGIHSADTSHQSVSPAIHNLPTPPLSSPKSPPLPAKKPQSLAHQVGSTGALNQQPSKANASQAPQSSPTSNTSRLLTELFDESPRVSIQVNIDTAAVLASRTPITEPNKIRTLRKQIWEVTSGGKLIPVPADQSHIIFEESLYICHHVFGTPAGTRTTEVYLWCGDGVATSAVEDAQIFARKEAKDHGGRLITLSQGKESATFFQALGGIVITRHGQSDRASKRYMLCGRRHVGQIAFDEVDFLPNSLCKGFPYIIASGSGKIYLWKGQGSGIDELGCARLIGMDLGLTGEIAEVDDGREPDSFWQCFPDHPPIHNSSDDSSRSQNWHLKSSCEKYATRLYKIDIEPPRPKSSSGFKWGRRGSAPASADDTTASPHSAIIKEIIPYAQSDVFNDGVFVLDGFFEVFVILPSFPSTSTLLPTFRTALLFAQEYAILAASSAEENRPFVPSVKVVLFGVGREDVPEGARMAFRKWEGRKVRGCCVLGVRECLEGILSRAE